VPDDPELVGAGRRQVALLRRSPAAWSVVDVRAYPTIIVGCVPSSLNTARFGIMNACPPLCLRWRFFLVLDKLIHQGMGDAHGFARLDQNQYRRGI
jgi:hypothetical protein